MQITKQKHEKYKATKLLQKYYNPSSTSSKVLKEINHQRKKYKNLLVNMIYDFKGD